MSDFRKEVVDKVAQIKSIVSNDEEATKVMACLADIIDAFSNQLLEVSRRQLKLEERTEEVFEVLSNIEEEMIQGMSENFEAECPYCGEEITYEIPEDGSDFKCPKCNKTIELEMMFDDCGCGCGCDDCDEDCDHDHHDGCCDCGCDCEDGECDCDDDCDCGCKD